MKKNHQLLFIIMVFIVITVVLSGILLFVLSNMKTGEDIFTVGSESKWYPPEDSLLIENITIKETNIVVISGCRAIAAETTEERALGISNARNNITEVRPDVYESIDAVLSTFNIKLEGVYVHSFEDGIFYADSYFRVDNSLLQLDMKPSDAIAIAFRTGSPIYYNKTLFDSLGQNIC